jgi:NitT/TauT family transport system ATP-binding protein
VVLAVELDAADYPAEVSFSADGTLSFVGVDKTFADGTMALRGVDLQVSAGEFVSVVGPSGCGKSTLLRLAAGLDSPSAGSVVVPSTRVSYVFQDPTLLPWRTVRRNVELLAELSGVSKAERRQRVEAAIGLVGLDGFEKHRPRELSGGMRMRVSLARSLVLEPDVFLFDEPFGALDEMARERLNDELLQLFTSRRFTGLFITHSVSEAVYLSTRVLVMSRRPGHIVGEVKVPFAYPRSSELRYDETFARVAAEVSDLLRDVPRAS